LQQLQTAINSYSSFAERDNHYVWRAAITNNRPLTSANASTIPVTSNHRQSETPLVIIEGFNKPREGTSNSVLATPMI